MTNAGVLPSSIYTFDSIDKYQSKNLIMANFAPVVKNEI